MTANTALAQRRAVKMVSQSSMAKCKALTRSAVVGLMVIYSFQNHFVSAGLIPLHTCVCLTTDMFTCQLKTHPLHSLFCLSSAVHLTTASSSYSAVTADHVQLSNVCFTATIITVNSDQKRWHYMLHSCLTIAQQTVVSCKFLACHLGLAAQKLMYNSYKYSTYVIYHIVQSNAIALLNNVKQQSTLKQRHVNMCSPDG